MVDSLSPKDRSEIMARVRSKNSRPEMLVRKLVFSLGYRYRLHRKSYRAAPIWCFRSRRKVILVHGCFWHRHAGCGLARMPKSRLEFWLPKLEGNKLRDRRNKRALAREGWKVLTVWECQIGKPERLRKTIRRFLDAKR